MFNMMTYCKILQGLEHVKLLDIGMLSQVWNVAGNLAGVAPWCLPNLRTIERNYKTIHIFKTLQDHRRHFLWYWNGSITVTSWGAQWYLKSPASWLFTQQFIQAQIKENIKALRHWPLWGKSLDSPHKGPVTWKRFPWDDAMILIN